jgi:hypothetical protein
MRSLGAPYCAVPSQAYVLRLYDGGWGVPEAGIRPVEPGSLWPATEAITLSAADSQAFGATVVQPVGGPPAGVRWTVDGSTVLTQTETLTYTPAPADVGRIVEVGLHVEDRTPLVHPERAGDALSYSHTWTVAVEGVPLAGVTIAGPEAGVEGQTDLFTATVTPTAGIGAVAYSWAPEPEAGQGTARAAYTWPAAGVYSLTVHATNVMGIVVSDTRTIEVEPEAHLYYLPLIYHRGEP